MRKKLLVITCAFLKITIAQVNFTPFDFQSKSDSVFSTLDTAKIPYRILSDKALLLSDILKYNGNPDTVCDFENFRSLYYDLYNMSFNRAHFISRDTLWSTGNSKTLHNRYPLLLLNFGYSSFKPNAFSDNLISYSNNHVYDNTINQSAYNVGRVFACASFIETFYTGTITFRLDNSLYFTNDFSNTLTNLSVDFGDGLGYRSASFNQNFAINYSSPGQYFIFIKAAYSNGATYVCKTQINILNADLASRITSEPASEFWAATQNNFIMNADINNPPHGYSSVWIRKGKDPATGLQRTCITQPLMFIEGIDFGKTHAFGKNGDLGYYDILLGNNPEYLQLQYGPQMLDMLYNAGYDVIYVDFWDGADYIENQAMILVNIIKNINNVKCGEEENVVVGASMGGQSSRYALAWMEKNNIKHCTREYISFDSPHRGANIPYGLQAFMIYFQNDSPKLYEALHDKIDRPAAQELLVYHHLGFNNNVLKQNWLGARDALGYPKKMRKTAIINGSEIASNIGYPQGYQIVTWNVNLGFGYAVHGNVWALPGENNNRIFEGEKPVPLNLWGCFNIPVGTNHTDRFFPNGNNPDYDVAPGSYDIKIRKFAGDQNTPCRSLGHIYTVDRTAFISSVSALDINSPDLFFNIVQNIPDRDQPSSYHPFDAFYAQEFNEQHVQITVGSGSNTEWLINELSIGKNNIPAALNSIYNLGDKYRKKIYSTSIQNGGILKINGIGTTNEIPSYPTVGNSSITVFTNDCGANVIIDNGGQFVVGEVSGNTNNKAIVHFQSGSILHIKAGGKLIINDNSKLVIEPGATLLYEPGSQIILDGTNALLEIQGTLQLADNSNFTFTFPPASQSGYVKFNAPAVAPTFLTDNINIGNNCSITFTGTGANDVVLEVDQESLYAPDQLVLFKIFKGKVVLGGSQARLNLGSPVDFQHVKVIGTTSVRGIHLYGQNGINIRNTQVEFCQAGIADFAFYGGNALNLQQCVFKNCSFGVYTLGAGVNFSNSVFKNNSTGWLADGLSYNSTVTSCDFNNNYDMGYQLSGGVAEVKMDNCRVNNNNSFGGEVFGNLVLNIHCGEIKHNGNAGLDIENNGYLRMSAQSGGGYVDISNNLLAVQLVAANGIDLNLGFNNLKMQGGGYNSSACQNLGYPHCPFDIEGTIVPFTKNPPTIFNANNNQWLPSNMTAVPSANYTNVYYTSGQRIFIKDAQQTLKQPCDFYSTINLCIPFPLTCNTRVIDNCPGCYIINTTDFINKRTSEATKTSMRVMDSLFPNNFSNAINKFHQVLRFPIPQPSAQDGEVLNIANREMQVSLSKGIESGQSQVSINNGPVSTDVQKVIDVLNDQFNDAQNDTSKYYQRLFAAMEKAITYRLAKRRDLALQLFNNILTWVRNEDKNYVLRWQCITFTENQVLTGQLLKENLYAALQTCLPPGNNNNSQHRLADAGVSENPEDHVLSKAKVYPNPTSNKLTLAYSINSEEKGEFIIFDLSGRKLLEQKIPPGDQSIEITNLNLDEGVYFYKIVFGPETFAAGKLVIIR